MNFQTLSGLVIWDNTITERKEREFSGVGVYCER
jgi:hypothetical protein